MDPAEVRGMTRRRLGLVLAAMCALLMTPTTALAARQATMTASPLTLIAGASSTVNLSVTNNGTTSGGDDMACVDISMPTTFTVTSSSVLSIGGATSGSRWQSWQANTTAHAVAFNNPSNKLYLKGGETAVFRVVGVASSVGTMTWTGRARNKPQLSGTTCVGSGSFAIAQNLAFTVQPSSGSTPTPSPTPSPTPTPRPTPTTSPAPTSTPIPSSSSLPRPSASAGSLAPSPSASNPPAVATLKPGPAQPSATPVSTEQPRPSESSSPATGVVAAGSEDEGGAGSGGAADQTQAVIGRGGLGVRTSAGVRPGIDLDGIFPTLSGGQWFVPGAVLGVPGLLVLLWVALQLAAGIAWLPAANRVRGNDRRRRRKVA
jgi:hypothetical protein